MGLDFFFAIFLFCLLIDFSSLCCYRCSKYLPPNVSVRHQQNMAFELWNKIYHRLVMTTSLADQNKKKETSIYKIVLRNLDLIVFGFVYWDLKLNWNVVMVVCILHLFANCAFELNWFEITNNVKRRNSVDSKHIAFQQNGYCAIYRVYCALFGYITFWNLNGFHKSP